MICCSNMYLLYWCQSFLPVREMNYVTYLYLMSKKVKVHFSSQFMDFHRVLNPVFSVLKLLNLAVVPMVVSKGWDRGGWCTFSHVLVGFPPVGGRSIVLNPWGTTPSVVVWFWHRHFCARAVSEGVWVQGMYRCGSRCLPDWFLRAS